MSAQQEAVNRCRPKVKSAQTLLCEMEQLRYEISFLENKNSGRNWKVWADTFSEKIEHSNAERELVLDVLREQRDEMNLEALNREMATTEPQDS